MYAGKEVTLKPIQDGQYIRTAFFLNEAAGKRECLAVKV